MVAVTAPEYLLFFRVFQSDGCSMDSFYQHYAEHDDCAGHAQYNSLHLRITLCFSIHMSTFSNSSPTESISAESSVAFWQVAWLLNQPLWAVCVWHWSLLWCQCWLNISVIHHWSYLFYLFYYCYFVFTLMEHSSLFVSVSTNQWSHPAL